MAGIRKKSHHRIFPFKKNNNRKGAMKAAWSLKEIAMPKANIASRSLSVKQ